MRGLQCRFDQNYDDQQMLVDNPAQFDPKIANALATITRDRSHQIIAAQSKLDRRFANQQRFEHSGTGGPMVIGWQTSETGEKADDAPSVDVEGGGAVRH